MRSLIGQAVQPSDHGNADPAAVSWRTSSASGANGACVQVAHVAGEVWVRDSKDPDGLVLKLPCEGWAAFVDVLRYATLGNVVAPTLTILIITSGSVMIRDRLTIRGRVSVRNWASSVRYRMAGVKGGVVSLRSGRSTEPRSGGSSVKRATLLFLNSTAARFRASPTTLLLSSAG
jgi:Domain of unknown function (DUF397)